MPCDLAQARCSIGFSERLHACSYTTDHPQPETCQHQHGWTRQRFRTGIAVLGAVNNQCDSVGRASCMAAAACERPAMFGCTRAVGTAGLQQAAVRGYDVRHGSAAIGDASKRRGSMPRSLLRLLLNVQRRLGESRHAALHTGTDVLVVVTSTDLFTHGVNHPAPAVILCKSLACS